MSASSVETLKRSVQRLGCELSIAETQLARARSGYQRAKDAYDQAKGNLNAALVQQAIDDSENVLCMKAARDRITKESGDADQA